MKLLVWHIGGHRWQAQQRYEQRNDPNSDQDLKGLCHAWQCRGWLFADASGGTLPMADTDQRASSQPAYRYSERVWRAAC